MWNRFSEDTQRAIFYAQEEAARFFRDDVGTEHLLIGLLRVVDSAAARLVRRLGADTAQVIEETRRELSRGDEKMGNEMRLSPAADRAVKLAFKTSRQLKNHRIGTEHVLLGILAENEGVAVQTLARFGIDSETVRRLIEEASNDDAGTESIKPSEGWLRRWFRR